MTTPSSRASPALNSGAVARSRRPGSSPVWRRAWPARSPSGGARRGRRQRPRGRTDRCAAPVPRDVVVRIAQPIVGGEIDRAPPASPQNRHRLLRFHMRQREEDHVRDAREPLGVEVVEAKLAQPPQMGIGLGERLAGDPVRGDARQRDVGMDAEQPEELRAHVPAGAGDRDADRRHYRFEYWNFCRAPGWPYFFRSRIRGSRVRRPAFSGSRNFSSNFASARARAGPRRPGPWDHRRRRSRRCRTARRCS